LRKKGLSTGCQLQLCLGTVPILHALLREEANRHILVVLRGKNRFVTATKLGTTNKIFNAATQNFAAATKRFVDRTKHFVVVTKHFCCPYFNK